MKREKSAEGRESGTPIDLTSPPTESEERDVGIAFNQFAYKTALNLSIPVADFHSPTVTLSHSHCVDILWDVI